MGRAAIYSVSRYKTVCVRVEYNIWAHRSLSFCFVFFSLTRRRKKIRQTEREHDAQSRPDRTRRHEIDFYFVFTRLNSPLEHPDAGRPSRSCSPHLVQRNITYVIRRKPLRSLQIPFETRLLVVEKRKNTFVNPFLWSFSFRFFRCVCVRERPDNNNNNISEPCPPRDERAETVSQAKRLSA